jgi:hypothetical protein
MVQTPMNMLRLQVDRVCMELLKPLVQRMVDRSMLQSLVEHMVDRLTMGLGHMVDKSMLELMIEMCREYKLLLSMLQPLVVHMVGRLTMLKLMTGMSREYKLQ